MCRLASLFRYFEVPANATHTQLRAAYLQRVKQVHPDRSPGSKGAAEFRDVQEKYEEASELIRVGAPRQRLRHSQDPDRGNPWRTHQPQEQHLYATKNASGVAAHGFSTQSVYPAAAASVFVAATASFLLSQRRQPSPTVAQGAREQKAAVAKAPAADPATERQIEKTYPPLEPGPWNVAAAKELAKNSKTVWAPSKAWEFQDNDTFYGGRTKGHMRANIGQRKSIGRAQGGQVRELGYEASNQPQMLGDIEVLPAHIAAADGNIWWLEACGATVQCRSTLMARDSVADTPLHHSARNGQADACRALLRLGADKGAKNEQELTPFDAAKAVGNDAIAELLREEADTCNRHPDGLGIHAAPPPSIVFTGLQDSGALRRAVNMACGYVVAPPLPITRAMSEAQNAADRMINVTLGSLQSTEFDLEDFRPRGQIGADFWQSLQRPSAEMCGFLLYEPPGSVTEDAPGHWVAVRRLPDASPETFFRMDPVRGPFQLTASELATLLGRYRAWCVLRKGEHVQRAREAQQAKTAEEAISALKARDG